MNGKVTSNVGQRVALWPVNPHEKHLKSDQLRRTCPNLGLGPVLVIAALRNKFAAMFPIPEAPPASAGPVLSSLFLTATIGPAYPMVITLGPSPGEGPLESILPTISLTVVHFDQPDCLVYFISVTTHTGSVS